MSPTLAAASSTSPALPPSGAVTEAVDDAPARGWRRWLSRGAWAMVDQAAFSVANFLVVLLLARWLSPDAFGRFAIAHTVFLLAATAYAALCVDAMLVYGPNAYKSRLEKYFGAILLMQAPVALLTASAVAAVGGVLLLAGAAPLGWTVLAMAAATPMLLLLSLARRPCYVTLNPDRAAVGGLAYLALVTVALFATAASGALTVFSGIAVMGGVSLIVAVGLLARERWTFPLRSPDATISEVARDHWNYARWAVASGLLGLLPSQLCYLVLPAATGDVEASGALRATSNLILPLIQANIAVGALLLPALSATSTPTASVDAAHRRRRLLFAAVGACVLIPAVAWVTLGLLGEPLLRLCYGDQYAHFGWLVWAIGAVPPLMGASLVLNCWLQSIRRQDAVFYSSLASAVTAATLGVALTWHDQLRGAAVGVCASIAVAIVISAAFAFGGSGGASPTARARQGEG